MVTKAEEIQELKKLLFSGVHWANKAIEHLNEMEPFDDKFAAEVDDTINGLFDFVALAQKKGIV